jgi:hypothetical protein
MSGRIRPEYADVGHAVQKRRVIKDEESVKRAEFESLTLREYFDRYNKAAIIDKINESNRVSQVGKKSSLEAAFLGGM